MKVLVVFHSMTGNVLQLARSVVRGAEQAGAEVRLRKVNELIPEHVLRSKPHLSRGQELLADIEIATLDDLRWADGVCFGSPTRYGNMSAQLKNYIDQTGALWSANELEGKAAACFTSSGTQHGGQESTLLTMMVPLFHLGFVVMGLPYSERAQMGVDHVHGGSPYGVSSVSDDSSRAPAREDLELAAALGRRLAILCERTRGLKRDWSTKRTGRVA